MIRVDGYKSLYRGLLAPSLGFGLTFAVSFGYLFVINWTYYHFVMNYFNSGYNHGCQLISQYRKKDINNLNAFELSLAGAYTGN